MTVFPFVPFELSDVFVILYHILENPWRFPGWTTRMVNRMPFN